MSWQGAPLVPPSSVAVPLLLDPKRYRHPPLTPSIFPSTRGGSTNYHGIQLVELHRLRRRLHELDRHGAHGGRLELALHRCHGPAAAALQGGGLERRRCQQPGEPGRGAREDPIPASRMTQRNRRPADRVAGRVWSTPMLVRGPWHWWPYCHHTPPRSRPVRTRRRRNRRPFVHQRARASPDTHK